MTEEELKNIEQTTTLLVENGLVIKKSPYCWNSTRKIERASAFLLGGTRADTTLQEMILWQITDL